MDTDVVEGALHAFLKKAGETNETLDLGVKVAVLVAAADGSIDDDEMHALAAVLAEVFGDMPEHIARVLVKDAAKHQEERDRVELAREMGAKLAERGAVAEGLAVAIAIARTSEGVADAERALLEGLAEGAGEPGALEAALA